MSDPMRYPPSGVPVVLPRPVARRRWRGGVVAVVVGLVAVVVGVAGFVGGRQWRGATMVASPTPVTVTADPPAPAVPAPLPTADADRLTCGSVTTDASGLIHRASDAQQVIPKGLTLVDAAVQDNPQWRAAVIDAAGLYDQAGDIVAVAPGTTPVLGRAAVAFSDAMHAMAVAFRTFDRTSGNAEAAARAAARSVDVMCDRLAPE